MLYLELGIAPIRFIVMSRRMMFYHYILNEDDTSLIYKFYKVQLDKAVKNDWCLQVKENLATLRIYKTEDQIRKLSEETFKNIVNSAIKKHVQLLKHPEQFTHKGATH